MLDFKAFQSRIIGQISIRQKQKTKILLTVMDSLILSHFKAVPRYKEIIAKLNLTK
jgi:hypothetical protein